MKMIFALEFVIILILSVPSTWAQTPKASSKKEQTAGTNVGAKTESYKDIIEKAYNLSLQKDRAQAIQILNGAIKRSATNVSAVTELKHVENDLGRLFYSEKAQQLYELSLSVRVTDPNQGFNKASEAMRIEPDNVSIILEVARQQMSKGDCSGAREGLLKAKKIYLHDEEVQMSLAQAYLCDGDTKSYLAIRSTVDLKKSYLVKNWAMLDIERLFRDEQIEQARALLLVYLRGDTKYPEANYWQYRIDKELKKDTKSSATKYLSLCKNLTHASFRMYMMDGLLCRRQAEVESAEKLSAPAND